MLRRHVSDRGACSFRILILGATSGLVETITDAVSIHSIKKAEYAKRLAQGKLGHVTLMDHFQSVSQRRQHPYMVTLTGFFFFWYIKIYGDASSAKFARARRNFAKSLAGYSIVTFLLQIKDRHNGNILLDRDGHLIHIDFGYMLSNTPGNIGFEAAPFKLPPEYIEVLGGTTGVSFLEFRRLFREGFEAARKHCDRIISEFSLSHIIFFFFFVLLGLLMRKKNNYLDNSISGVDAKGLDVAVFRHVWRTDGALPKGQIPTYVDAFLDWRVCRPAY